MENCGPIVAGHQPNFLPWFGYFEKMLKCDIFVYSDDVQYPKQSWVNRVPIPISGATTWLSLPVTKGGDGRIADKCYVADATVLDRLIKTVRINFGGFPFANDLEPVLEHFSSIFLHGENLADLNIQTISHIAASLGIKTPTHRGMDLGLEIYHRNERLIERCKMLSSTMYLCGQGADSYQDEAMLAQAGIELCRIDYAVGHALLGEDMKYSILHSIAKYGTNYLRAGVEKFILDKKGDLKTL